MRRRRWWVAMALMALVVGPVAAQMGMGGPPMPPVHGVWSPVVGSGAAYNMEYKGKKSEMEFAIVGTEAAAGKTGHWLEVMFKDPREGEMVMKSLIVLEEKNTRVVRMIMQSPEMGAMEFPMEMVGRGRMPSVEEADIRERAEHVGTETVETPAGTFTCEHYRSKDKDGNVSDAWVSEKVAPYGLVKMTSKDTSMLLTRVITGARTRIIGTPRSMRDMMRQPPD